MLDVDSVLDLAEDEERVSTVSTDGVEWLVLLWGCLRGCETLVFERVDEVFLEDDDDEEDDDDVVESLEADEEDGGG